LQRCMQGNELVKRYKVISKLYQNSIIIFFQKTF
jgi:hypothetical protein